MHELHCPASSPLHSAALVLLNYSPHTDRAYKYVASGGMVS